MANLAQIVNVLQAVILTNGHQMVKTPTYHVFQMYNVHQDAALIPIKIQSERYEYNGESIPAVTASASEKDGVINLTLTNSNPNKTVEINSNLEKDFSTVTGRIVNGKKLTDFNDFGKEEAVLIRDFKDVKLNGKALQIKIPAHSVVLLQLRS